MTQQEINVIIEKQKEYFARGTTLDINHRIAALNLLRSAIKRNEEKIANAIKNDLGKSAEESYMCETGLVISEISYMIKHVRKFAKDKTVATPITNFLSHSFVRSSPYGNVLIMSPWNYPFLLTMDPLCDALAAGNTAIVKPSAYSPETSRVMKEIIEECFSEDYVAVVTGGREENNCLLNCKFDYIFFTGSKNVGTYVMEKASSKLTPVTLELGGKSPCIVHSDADIKLSARRIVFGKYLNCGQTCVAPDYVLCHRSVKDAFIKAVKKEINRQYGKNPLANENYGKIINERHFDRICSLIDKEKVVHGGEFDENTLKITPTVMDNVVFDDAVMQEEIFGPVMPVIVYDDIDDAVQYVNSHDKPLAFYIFTKSQKLAHRLLSVCSFGGGCINDVVIHLATSNMGFGGVGESGMGSYHGKCGFDTFSHKKSIVDKKRIIDLPMRYQPYTKLYTKMIRMFLK